MKCSYPLAYIDDLLVFSTDFPSHVKHLRELFSRLRDIGLKLKPSKCQLAVPKVQFLGHILTKEGIQPNPDKVKCILDFPTPTKVKSLRSFLGASGYYRKHIKNYSVIAKPLYNLTKNNCKFLWTPDCQKAFDDLKQALSKEPVLMFLSFHDRFILACDASQSGIGSTLSQTDSQGNIKPIAYAGRSLTPAEQNYTTTEQELLAVVWSLQHFRVYLEGAEFDLYTDHAALTSLLKDLHPPPFSP